MKLSYLLPFSLLCIVVSSELHAQSVEDGETVLRFERSGSPDIDIRPGKDLRSRFGEPVYITDIDFSTSTTPINDPNSPIQFSTVATPCNSGAFVFSGNTFQISGGSASSTNRCSGSASVVGMEDITIDSNFSMSFSITGTSSAYGGSRNTYSVGTLFSYSSYGTGGTNPQNIRSMNFLGQNINNGHPSYTSTPVGNMNVVINKEGDQMRLTVNGVQYFDITLDETSSYRLPTLSLNTAFTTGYFKDISIYHQYKNDL